MKTTATGWQPTPGDLVDVWVTAPGEPPVASMKWVRPWTFVGTDTGPDGRPRWVLAQGVGPAYVYQTESSLHAVEPQGTLW